MEADANLEHHGRALADAVEAVMDAWVVRCVVGRVHDFTGGSPSDDVLDAARSAGEQARADVVPRLRALLARDVDEQRVNPLLLLRAAVTYPTGVLRKAGVPPIVRDEFDERAFPDDVYGLTPASFADVDASLHEPGLVWGAAKAHAHLVRRRR
jgi:hypothetical protein